MDYLQRISRELDLPPAEKAQALAELRAHFQDIRDDLVAKSASIEDAEKEAAAELGSPESIAAGLGAVHLRDGWKSVLLSLLPFLAAVPIWMMSRGIHSLAPKPDRWAGRIIHLDRLLVLAGEALLVSFGLAMLIIGIRELLRNKRPTWLAPCLAVAILWPVGFLVCPGAPDQLWFFLFWAMISSGLLTVCGWMPPAGWKLLAVGAVGAALAGLVPLIIWLEPPAPVALLAPVLLALPAAGLALFARHPHSTPSRASLFIFACYAFLMLLHQGFALAMTVTATMAAVFVYSRVADKKIKYATLLCAAAAMTAASWDIRGQQGLDILVMVAVLMLIPALFEFRRGSAGNALIAE
jgi:hypothetical protein